MKTNIIGSIIENNNEKQPKTSEYGLLVGLGKKWGGHVRTELDIKFNYERDQFLYVLGLNEVTTYSASFLAGYSDSLFNQYTLFLAPYYEYLRGASKSQNNSQITESNIGADIFGFSASLTKEFHKSYGIQLRINTQYEIYPQNLNPNFLKTRKRFSFFPMVLMTYNF